MTVLERGGGGLAARAPEQEKRRRSGGGGGSARAPGVEPRQPASPAPQGSAPAAWHATSSPSPRPSRGRAWTHLSKCDAPATEGPRPRDPGRRGGAGGRREGSRCAPAACPWFLCRARGSLLGDPGDTGRGAGGRRQECGRPGASAGPSRLPGTLPKATSGQKVCTGACTRGRSERAVQSEGSPGTPGLLPFPSQFLHLLSVWSWKGTLQVEPPPPGPRRIPSGSAGGAVAHGAGDPRVRRCEFTSELTQASRDFRAAEQHGS